MSWGFARYSDGIVGIQWMLDHSSPFGNNTDIGFLWELTRAIRDQADGTMSAEDHTWEDFFVHGDPYTFPPGKGLGINDSGTIHLRYGVDIGQDVKVIEYT